MAGSLLTDNITEGQGFQQVSDYDGKSDARYISSSLNWLKAVFTELKNTLGTCRKVHTSEGQCIPVEDSAFQCRTVHTSVGQCIPVQDSA
jgi:hypothetical protein